MTDTAIEVAADHRCGLATINGGRCGGSSRYEIHHIKLRSHGGGNEPENLVPLCPEHHRRIHDAAGTARLNGPYEDRGRTYYTETLVDGAEVSKIRWYLWRDVREQFESKEQRIHDALMRAAEQINHAKIGAAVLLAEIDSMGLYELRGYDSTTHYAMGELGASESSARNALRVGEWLRVNPHILERAQESGLYFSAIRDCLPALKALPGERVAPVVDEMIAYQNDGTPVEAIVDAVRDAAGKDSTRNEYDVTAKLGTTGGAVTLRVSAADPEGARRAFERIVGASGRLEGVLTVTHKRTRKV